MIKTPGACDNETRASNQTAAAAMVGDRSYGEVQVTVVHNDQEANTVRLLLPIINGEKTIEVEMKWGDIEVMWAPCPSSLPSAAVPGDAGPVPKVGAAGVLLLSRDVLAPNNVESGIQHGATKWPREWGDDGHYYQSVRVWPTRILVTGVTLSSGSVETHTVDVLDPEMAKPGQAIRTDHHTLSLNLTRNGCLLMGQTFDAVQHLSVAIDVILKEKSNPDMLMEAWRIVSIVVDQYRVNTVAHDNVIGLLRKVLPGYGV